MIEVEILDKKVQMWSSYQGEIRSRNNRVYHLFLVHAHVWGAPLHQRAIYKFAQEEEYIDERGYLQSLAQLAINATQTDLSFEEFCSHFPARNENENLQAYIDCHAERDMVNMLFPELYNDPCKLYHIVNKELGLEETIIMR